MNRIFPFALTSLCTAAAACGGADESADDSTLHSEASVGPGSGSGEAPEPAEVSGGGEDPDPGGRALSDLVLSGEACEIDEDCVPAGCCHASACVAQANAPACEEVMCTQDCQYGTLDCGGSCLCHEGRCAARLSEQPPLPGSAPQ